MIRKTLSANIEKAAGVKVEATITTETIDRDGEVLISQGMDATEYELNPVVFYNHDYAQPIGRISEIRRGKGKIDATIEFAQRPDNFEGSYLPQFVESLVVQGIVKGISVGFVPIDGGVRKASKKIARTTATKCDRSTRSGSCYEVSVAPLPANATALVSAVRKGLVAKDDAVRWLDFDANRRVIEISVPTRGRLSTI
jgi:HK97 family phage prohead protease